MDSETAGGVAIEADDYMGETPIWSSDEQALYWINCENPPRLRRWDPGTREIRSWDMPERIGGLALRRGGNPVVCLASGVYEFQPASGKLALLAPSPFPKHVKLHESCVDRAGRLWVGGFDARFGPDDPWPGGAAICRLEGKRLVPMIPGLSVTNSLAFSPDGRQMYFTDTLRRLIWQVDIEPASGAILGMREFITIEDARTSDGAAVDTEGGYWLAIYGGGEVRRYLPDGRFSRALKLPFSQPTKPAFGGANLTKLYVTSTQIEVPGYTNTGPNGAIQELDAGIRGLAENYFAG